MSHRRRRWPWCLAAARRPFTEFFFTEFSFVEMVRFWIVLIETIWLIRLICSVFGWLRSCFFVGFLVVGGVLPSFTGFLLIGTGF